MVAKLYYTPTSCGGASFIAAYHGGLFAAGKLTAEEVNTRTHKTASGADFYAINPKGNVPTLVLDDGTVLNEGAACLQWIADQAAPGLLAPAYGTSGRYLVQSKLNYVASEMHASIAPMFNPANSDEIKAVALANFKRKLAYLSEHELKDHKFVAGNEWTVADSYLSVVLSWGPYVGFTTLSTEFPILGAYLDAFNQTGFVVEARAAMAAAPHPAAA